MVAFNFMPQFAELVASGVKTQTLRRNQKAKVGKRLQLYTGQRTKNCRKLITPDPVVVLVDYCAIRKHYITFGNSDNHPRCQDEFARADGFADYAEMYDWFCNRYKASEFVGYVTKWQPFTEE